MKKFSWPVRIYYEDTDSGGVVYYANYLRYMERARTEWLRSLGFEQDELIANEGVIFAVRSVEADYMSPAVFNDHLQVSADIIETGRASLTFEQEIRRQGEDRVLCRGKVRIVCVRQEGMKPCSIPKSIMTKLKGSGSE